MKLKTALPFIFTILLFSCIDLGSFDDDAYVGVAINVNNKTNREFKNLKLHIGGLQDSTFISTNFYELPTISFNDDGSFVTSVLYKENRWKTDLKKINEISKNAYFSIELSNNEMIILKDRLNNTEFVNFLITNEKIIKNEYGGILSISLNEDSNITARYFEDTEFR